MEQAQLIDANPDYARVKYNDGRELLVSVCYLAVPSEAIPQTVEESIVSRSPVQVLSPTQGSTFDTFTSGPSTHHV